jgi:hypothetical protein
VRATTDYAVETHEQICGREWNFSRGHYCPLCWLEGAETRIRERDGADTKRPTGEGVVDVVGVAGGARVLPVLEVGMMAQTLTDWQVDIKLDTATITDLFEAEFWGWCHVCKNVKVNENEPVCCECFQKALEYHVNTCGCYP